MAAEVSRIEIALVVLVIISLVLSGSTLFYATDTLNRLSDVSRSMSTSFSSLSQSVTVLTQAVANLSEAVTPPPPPTPEVGGTLTIAISGMAPNLDPRNIEVRWGVPMLIQCVQPLFAYTPDWVLVPVLAESYQ